MKVVKAKINDIDKAVDLAFSMQSNIETRCRSLLLDASREQIYDMFSSYVERDEHEILLVEKDGKLEGLTPIYWMEEDLYVSYAQGPYGYDYEAVANCLYDYVAENFKGYKFYVNTASEHTKSIKFYENKDFQKIEEAVMLKLENFSSDYSNEFVQELNKNNSRNLYNWIEGCIDQDTYWNSKRISENLDRFIILGYFEKGIKGHIIGRGSVNYTEIIAFSGDEIVKEKLFRSFISKANKRNVKLIDLYTEDDYEVSLGTKYGFKLYDNNNCFLKYL
ncbi:hypothetical protein JYG23_00150 [Sedimentibacter sp. zth1]|uniref:hypothetical protein n=1 Tax=Sedimentibacter sp. zth1 TaxID=2816908 RepID=UPI001A938C2C|nr:hypothetical protein [Sedimentibacter sp. zth1]QSX05919.1 hypothetical protein JYG23_00150 [Sedimentibacter sp. zth1]